MSSVPNTNNKDVSYVEASMYDTDKTADTSKTANNVWKAVKPPSNLGANKPPMVSSRKLEIIRAQLNGNKIRGNEQNINTSKTTLRISTTRVSRKTIF